MTVEIMTGDIFQSGCVAVVNPTNAHNGGNTSIPHGYMGAGLALEFARRFPDMAAAYYDECAKGLEAGRLHWWEVPEAGVFKYVINFPTKWQINRPSSYRLVESGLESLAPLIAELQIQSIAIPALGCGYGRLEWIRVRDSVVWWAEKKVPDVAVKLYAPQS